MNAKQIEMMKAVAANRDREADYHLRMAVDLERQAADCRKVAADFTAQAVEILEGIEE